MKIVRNLTAMAAVATALTISAQARADTINFLLSSVEGGGTNSNPVEVVVSTWTTSAYTTLATGSSIYATVEFEGPGGANIPAPVGINVNGSANKTTGTYFASSTEGLGGGNPCGFGEANSCTGGNTNSAGSFNTETGSAGHPTVTIDVTAANGNTWTDAADVLVGNVDGWEAADNMGGTPQDLGKYVTPLPAALPLFTSGLGVMGLFGWRRKRKASAALAA
jgi:hypothetical protein